jgi:hypothetical protein
MSNEHELVQSDLTLIDIKRISMLIDACIENGILKNNDEIEFAAIREKINALLN